MPRYNFTSPRLHVHATLAAGARIDLGPEQAHYVHNVLRLKEGAFVLAFNGRDGEWSSSVTLAGKKRVALVAEQLTRPQPDGADLHYLFAPLKHARLDYMAQKAVEMGASRLVPVITRRTQVARVNDARLRANVIEAAEQCGILVVPEVAAEQRLDTLLASWPADRLMIFCDEDVDVGNPVATLAAQRQRNPGGPSLAVIIGPEGGFDDGEREALLRLPSVVRLSLGPRILRADTAAVAALALIQAVLGDGADERHSRNAARV